MLWVFSIKGLVLGVVSVSRKNPSHVYIDFRLKTPLPSKPPRPCLTVTKIPTRQRGRACDGEDEDVVGERVLR